MPEADDGVRATRGVVACLRSLPEGGVRLILDDVQSDSPTNPSTWTPTTLFTWTQLDSAKVAEISYSQDELAEIGFNLIARLAALNQTT